MFDAARYIALATRLQLRAKQIRDNPPKSIAEYAALVEEGKSIFDELMGQRQQPDFDTAALKSQRESDAGAFKADDGDLDKLPPLPPPDPKPTAFAYGKILDSDPPDSLLVNRDEIYRTDVGGVKFMARQPNTGPAPNLNFPEPGGWELHRRVSK